MKESRNQTVAELLQNANPKTKIFIDSSSTGDEFEGDVGELHRGEFTRFLYYGVRYWTLHNNEMEIACE